MCDFKYAQTLQPVQPVKENFDVEKHHSRVDDTTNRRKLEDIFIATAQWLVEDGLSPSLALTVIACWTKILRDESVDVPKWTYRYIDILNYAFRYLIIKKRARRQIAKVFDELLFETEYGGDI